MMEEHPNAALTRRVFEHGFGHDPKVIAAALSRDVVWRVPGTSGCPVMCLPTIASARRTAVAPPVAAMNRQKPRTSCRSSRSTR